MKNKISPDIKSHVVLLGTALGVLFYFLDAFVDAIYFHEGTFLDQVFHPNPVEIWIRSMVFCLFIVFSVYVDILFNRQRWTEEALSLTQFTIDNFSEAAFWINPKAKFIYVNDAACRSLKYSRAELLSMSVHDIDPNFQADIWPDHWEETKRRGSFILESVHRTKDGRKFPVEISINYISFHGKEYHCAFARDITTRKLGDGELQRAKEEAEKASLSKSEFLANMSHELRTPLTAILGFTKLLSETELSKDQSEWVRIMSESGIILLNLINDLFDLSKIESGNMKLQDAPFDLRMFLDQTLKPFLLKAEKKGLAFSFFMEPDIPAIFISDSRRVRQVLVNLVDNAIKFTPQGEVAISVRMEHSSRESSLVFSVRDTGIGIPRAMQQTIFESFRQVDGSSTRRFGGTGLGLSLSKHLVELMSGEIGMESEENKGSTFRFALPFKTIKAGT